MNLFNKIFSYIYDCVTKNEYGRVTVERKTKTMRLYYSDNEAKELLDWVDARTLEEIRQMKEKFEAKK